MTLQQLKYVVKVAEKGSINEAAKELFISQPSLSNAIIELEKELRFPVFIRSNRGVSVTQQGTEFLGYARQVLIQSDMLEARFISGKGQPLRFSVSTQHYTFVANAFVDLVKEYGATAYEFELNETSTYQIIENVKTMVSELGVMYLSNYNESVIRKILKENDLIFTSIVVASPHIFIYRNHPLANKEMVGLEDLAPFPCISYTQGRQNALYFSEEVLSTRTVRQQIRVSDRAAVANFMIGVNAYTISTGIFPGYLHGDDIIALPLDVDEKIEVGVIHHRDAVLSEQGQRFCDALYRYTHLK